jgi:hypothetical protein
MDLATDDPAHRDRPELQPGTSFETKATSILSDFQYAAARIGDHKGLRQQPVIAFPDDRVRPSPVPSSVGNTNRLHGSPPLDPVAITTRGPVGTGTVEDGRAATTEAVDIELTDVPLWARFGVGGTEGDPTEHARSRPHTTLRTRARRMVDQSSSRALVR